MSTGHRTVFYSVDESLCGNILQSVVIDEFIYVYVHQDECDRYLSDSI